MIIDQLENLERYHIPRLKEIIQFIRNNDCEALANEQINLDGEDLFVKVMEYEPREASENKFEIHHRYADLQYMVCGTEIMQYAPSMDVSVLTAYDEAGDYQFLQAHNSICSMVVGPGQAAVFYPREAHRPSCAYQGNKKKVKKLVFKIRINT